MLGEFGPWACHLAGVQHLLERPGREAKVGDQRFNAARRHPCCHRTLCRALMISLPSGSRI